MRENIGLYRGKRKDNGEWVEGVYYKQTLYYGDPCEKHYIITSTESLDYDQALEYYEVDPKSIGEYSGLHDERGKRIFEGDVIEFGSTDYYGSKEVGEVVFKDGCYGIEYIPDYARKFALKTSKDFHRIGEVDKWQDMGASGTISYKYYKLGDMRNG